MEGEIRFNEFDTSETLPIYCKYNGQSMPQPGRVTLEPDGEITIDYNPEIGNAIPEPQWNGRWIVWSCSPYLSAQALNGFISDFADRFETVLDGLSIDWDGRNKVGKLSDAARIARLEIEIGLGELERDEENLDIPEEGEEE